MYFLKHIAFSIDADICYSISAHWNIPWIQLNMTAILYPIGRIKQNKYDYEYDKGNIVELFSIHPKLKCDEKHYSEFQHCCKYKS